MVTVSFRLTPEARDELVKIPEHTKYVQQAVLDKLGRCITCGSNLTKRTKKHEKSNQT